MTLGALAARRCTGQLSLSQEGRRFCIAFDHGAVVGASSPLPADSAVRVAMIHRLISPAQATEIARSHAAAPARDELDLVTEIARLPLTLALPLRRKVLEQRAARTFGVDVGELVIDDVIDVPVVSGVSIDVRGVIYQGARRFLAAQRLADELRWFGVHFALAPGAGDELAGFGFGEAEQPIVDALRAGTSLAQLEATRRDLDPRMVQAVIYALAACHLCKGVTPPGLVSPGAPAAFDAPAIRIARASRGAPITDGRADAGDSGAVARARSRDLGGAAAPEVMGATPTTAAPEGSPRPIGAPIELPAARRGFASRPPADGPIELPAARGGIPGQRPTRDGVTRGAGVAPAGGEPLLLRGPLRAPAAAPDEAGVPRSTGTTGPHRAARAGATPTSPIAAPPDPAPPSGADAAAGASAPAAPRTTTTPTTGRTSTRPTSAPPLARAATDPPAALASGRTPTPSSPSQPSLPALTHLTAPAAAPAAGAAGHATGERPAIGAARTQTPVSLPGTHPASLGPGARSRTATATGAPPAAEIAAEATPRLSPAEAAAAAAEASKRGLARLKAEDFEGAILELKRATELVPTEVNYAATLAWALFCHETDKPKIAKETRDKLREAIRKSSTPEIAQFYLGRVERMLGRDREARTYFLEVLDAQPKHAEAAAELRVIELRLRKR